MRRKQQHEAGRSRKSRKVCTNPAARARSFRLKPLAQIFRGAALPAGLILSAGTVFAGPQGGRVTAGEGSISTPDANTTLVNQQSHRMAVDWSSFNIGHNELVRFNQPSRSSSALNRIYDQNPSQIYGSLRANGQVVLVNPNGVFFKPTARVNVGSLVASGLNIDTNDFMAGKFNFQALADEDGGLVVNQGVIQAATGGSVSLIGGAVKNEGIIMATAGQVNLGAGRKITMDFDGDGLMQFAVDEEVLQNAQGLDSAVSNTGEIHADGGSVLLTGRAAKDVFSNVVNNEGIIRAGRIENQGGKIKLVAGGSGNSLINTGTLDASAADSQSDGGRIDLIAEDKVILDGSSVVDVSSVGGKGGTVHALGDKVGLLGMASIDASGALGGGEVLIGGDVQGQNPAIRNASAVFIGEDAELNADAVNNGDGGKIIIYADKSTKIAGTLSARGGSEGGNGGFIETSGKESFAITNTPDITAPEGTAGQWLIDPYNITIVAGGGNTNINATSPFDPTGNDAQLGVDLITGALTGGATVTVTTGADGGQLGNISLQTALNYDATGTNTLILDAANNIEIQDGTGSITETGGDDVLNLQLTAGGNIVINGGINLNGGSFTATTTGGTFDTDTSAVITAGIGDITATSGDSFFSDDATFSGGLTFDAGNNVLNIDDGATLTLGADSSITTTDLLIETSPSASFIDATGVNLTLIQADGADFTLGTGGQLIGAELQSITAGTFDIQTTGNIIVDGITAANSTNIAGLTTLTSTGATFSTNPSTFENSLSVDAATVNLGVDVTVNNGTLSGTATTVNVQNDTASIQDGIDVVDTGVGGTVNVAAGTYVGDLTITTANLELAGAGIGTSIIEGVATQSQASFPDTTSSTNIAVNADDFLIHDFTVMSPDAAAGDRSSGMVIDGQNAEIHTNRFIIRQQADASITANGNTSVAIQTASGAVVPTSNVDGLNIHDNEFQGTPEEGYYGVYINPQGEVVGSNVTINNNTFTGTIWRGITTERSQTLITNNTITTGTAFTDFSTVASGNSGNSGIMVVAFAGSTSVDDISITGNTIDSTGTTTGFEDGIRIGFPSATLNNSYDNLTITGNFIGDAVNGGHVTGLALRDGSTSFSSGPDISGNRFFSSTTQVLDEAGTGIDANTHQDDNEFDFAAYVDSGSAIYSGVQDAIDAAADGEMVFISGNNIGGGNSTATYVGDLTITTDNITLTRDADFVVGDVKIKGVQTDTQGNFPTYQNATSILLTADGVTIDGLTLETPDVAAGDYAALLTLDGENISITNNDFISIQGDAAPAGANDSLTNVMIQSIANLGGASDIDGLLIDNNTFTGDGKGYYGVYLNQQELSIDNAVTVSNNTFNGNIWRAISTERTDTDITGNIISPGTETIAAWGGSGIAVRNFTATTIDDVLVSGNTINTGGANGAFANEILLGAAAADPLTDIDITSNTGSIVVTGDVTEVDTAINWDTTGDITVNGDLTGLTNDMVLDATGAINVAAASTLNTTDNALTLTATNMDLQGTINAGTSLVSLQTSTAGTVIDIGGADVAGTTLGLTDAELDGITTSGGLTIGAVTNTGGINITAAVNPGSVTGTTTLLQGSGNIVIADAGSYSTGSEALTLDTDTGAIDGDGGNTGTDLTAGTLTLNASTGIGTTNGLETAADTISFDNATNNVVVSNASVAGATVSGNAGTGNIDITETGGDLTIGAADLVTQNGTVDLTVTTADAALISLAGSDIDSVNGGTGGMVTITSDDLQLGGNITAGDQLVTIKPNDNAQVINVGTNTASQLGLSDAELDNITTSGGLTIGAATNTGGLNITAAVAPGSVTGTTNLLQGSGNIVIADAGSYSTGVETLTLDTASGAIQGDSGNTATDLTAGTLNLNSATGTGATNALETDIDILNADVSGTGDMAVLEADSISLADIDTADGDITVTATLGDIVVQDVDAAGTHTVTLDSTAGSINDGGATSEVITADSLRLNAETGINSFDIAVSNLAAETEEGNIEVFNTGALMITTVNGLSGVTITDTANDNGGDAILITASSPLTINDDVVDNDGGDITLAAEGNADADDLTIAANITAADGDGNIDLYAGDDINQTSGNVTAAGNGTIRLNAGVDYNAGGGLLAGFADSGTITQSGGTIAATNGTVDLSASEDVSITSVSTAGNVNVTADADFGLGLDNDSGAISENGADATTDISGATATLRAATGIGGTDAIETNITTLNALNDISGNLQISEVAAGGALDIALASSVVGNIAITAANGVLTVTDNGGIGVVSTTGTGTVSLSATGGNLVVNDGVDAVNGKVTLASTDADVVFDAEGDVTTTSGEIEINASNAITMVDGTILDAGDDLIDLNAGGTVALGVLTTTSTDGTEAVAINAGGAVTEVTSAAAVITTGGTGRTAIVADGGIGSGDAIETSTGSVSLTNTTGGNIAVDEVAGGGDLDIALASNVVGNVAITTASGALTVLDNGGAGVVSTTGAGTVSLSATGGNLVVNDGISAGTGDINLTTLISGDVVMNAANGAISGTDVFIDSIDNAALHDVTSTNLTVNVDTGDVNTSLLDLGGGTLTVTNTIQLAGGTDLNDTLRGQPTGHDWTITGANAGEIDASFAAFSSFDKIAGDNSVVSDTIDQTVAAADPVGSIDVVLSAEGTNDGMAGTITGLIDFDNIDVILNDDAGNSITGAPAGQIADAIWTIDGVGTEDNYSSNDGSPQGLDFSTTFDTLTGGSGNDVFNITASYTADVNTGDGTNKVVLNSTAGAVLTGNITGGSGADSIIFGNDDVTDDDDNDFRVVGNIDGGAGTDTLDFEDSVLAQTVTNVDTAIPDIDGFEGTITDVSGVVGGGDDLIEGEFNNIDSLVGNGKGDIIGPDAETWWMIEDQNAGTFGTSFATIGTNTFNNFRIIGGNDSDYFIFDETADADIGQVTGGINGGLGINTLVGSNGDDIFTTVNTVPGGLSEIRIDVDGTGTLTVLENIDNIDGSVTGFTDVGNDTFNIVAGLGWTGDLGGGGGNDIFNIDEVVDGDIRGDAGSDDFNLAASINVTGAISGGDNDDTFDFGDDATVGGIVDGGAGTGDSINWAAYTTARDVVITNLDGNGADGTEGSTGGFTDIEDIISAGIAGTAGDSLTGPDQVTDWDVTSGDDGNIDVGGNVLTFTDFGNLTGGTNSDTFNIGAALTGNLAGGNGTNDYNLDTGGSVAGDITGGTGDDTFDFNDAAAAVAGTVDGGNGGTNILDYADLAGPVTITLTDTGNDVGFTGTADNTGGFDNITEVVGTGNADDNLIGDIAAGGAFTVAGGGNTYVSGNTLIFSAIADLTGGAGVDSFDIDTAHAGDLSGQGDDDVFNFNNGALAGTVTGDGGNDAFDLAGGTVTGDIDGGAGGNTLTLHDVANTITINNVADGVDDGVVTGVTGNFFDIGTITGGSSTDDFDLNGGTLSGAIDGAGGVNSLTLDDVANSIVVTDADEGTATGVNGGFVNIGNITGGSVADDFTINSGASLSGSIDGVGGIDILNLDDDGNSVVIEGTGTGRTGDLNGGAAGGFNGIEDLFTGGGADTVDFDAAATIDIFTEGGSDIINLDQAVTGTVDAGGAADTVNLATGGSATTLTGAAGSDEIVGPNAAVIWILNGAQSGSVGGQPFTSMELITGNANVDTFNMTGGGSYTTVSGVGNNDLFNVSGATTSNLVGSAGNETFDIDAVLTGSLSGGTGSDTLQGNLIDAVTLTGSTVDGYSGTEADITGDFTGINILTGNGGTLTGDDVTSTWTLAAITTYDDGGAAGSLTFSGFANAQGGTASDMFDLTVNNTLNLAGGSGADDFNFTAGTLTGTVTGEAGNDTFNLDGGSATGTLAGGTDNDIFNVNTATAQDLAGNAGADTFNFNAGALTGTVSGDADNDTFNLSGGTVTGTVSGNAGTDTLTGGSDYVIDGTNTGTVTGITGGWDTIESLTGTGGNDSFIFNGGTLTGNVDGLGGTDILDLANAPAANATITLTGTGSANGFTGTASTGATGTFDNINDLVAGGGTDTLVGDIDAGGTFNIPTATNGTYVSTNTLNYSGIENKTGGSGADTFNINVSHAGNLNGAAGNDTFNFNNGTQSGSLVAGTGSNTYNFNGGNVTGTINIVGDDTWNHAAGVSLGDNITGTGSLTVPDSGGGDLLVGPGDLNLPNLQNFNGHFIVGGTLTPPTLPLDGNTQTVINSDNVTLDTEIILGTGGDFTMLGSNLDLNADILAGGSGPSGGQINLIVVGDTNGGSGPGDITAVANPLTLSGSGLLMIAENDLVNAPNISVELGGGLLEVAIGSGNTPQFGFLDAQQNQAGTPETNAFLANLNLTNASFVQAQILVLSNLIGLEQIVLIDLGLFEEDLSLFGVIGRGVALSLAQCEEIEGCAPDVTEEELNELIAQLEGRIEELQRRLEEATGSEAEQIKALIAGYQQELENFRRYRVELQEYYAVEDELESDAFTEEFGDEAPDEFTQEDAIASEIQRLNDILEVTRRRVDWLESLKNDADARARLGEITGMDVTVETLEEIIDATRQHIMSIEQQIQRLLEGQEAGIDSDTIFRAESGNYDDAIRVGYDTQLFDIDETFLSLNQNGMNNHDSLAF